RELAHALADATRARRPTALVTAINPLASAPAGAKSCLALGAEGVVTTPPLPVDEKAIQTFSASVSAGKPELFTISPQGEVVEDSIARGEQWPRVFVDVQPGLQTVIICGAGHIAQPLCEITSMMGFRTIVVDDRWAFASRERFPHATEVRVGPF